MLLRCVLAVATGVMLTQILGARVQGAESEEPKSKLEALILDAIADGQIVGAQLEEGNREGVLSFKGYGHRNFEKKERVDRETMFLIASCSKPLFSTCVLRLVESGELNLNDPVGKWLPKFGSKALLDGTKAERAPTIRESLAHRAGFLPQSGIGNPLTRYGPRHAAAVLDFEITLEKAVDLLSELPLAAKPGENYAYSGDGYLVVARCAEIAVGSSMEEILQKNLCGPLGLRRTTYFPQNYRDNNVSSPGFVSALAREQIWPQSYPHNLGESHRMINTSVGIYTTASELGVFARMMLNKGKVGTSDFLSAEAQSELTKRQFPGQRYGLGWKLQTDKGDRVTALSHTGSHYGYLSDLRIDLKKGAYQVFLSALGSQYKMLPPKLSMELAGRRLLGVGAQAEDAGLRVTRVTKGSPAAEADVRVGDYIVAFDSKNVKTLPQLRDAVRDGGMEVTVKLRRGQEELEIVVAFSK